MGHACIVVVLGGLVSDHVDVLHALLQRESACSDLTVLAACSEADERFIRLGNQQRNDDDDEDDADNAQLSWPSVADQLRATAIPANTRVTIRRLPLHTAPLVPDHVLLPACAQFFAQPGAVAWSRLGDVEHTQYRTLAVHLRATADLVAGCACDVDCFALGPAARLVAEQACATPRPGSRPAHKVSVVLIDRALDMASPSSHSDTFGDRMFGALPESAPTMDVAVSMMMRSCEHETHSAGRSTCLQ